MEQIYRPHIYSKGAKQQIKNGTYKWSETRTTQSFTKKAKTTMAQKGAHTVAQKGAHTVAQIGAHTVAQKGHTHSCTKRHTHSCTKRNKNRCTTKHTQNNTKGPHTKYPKITQKQLPKRHTQNHATKRQQIIHTNKLTQMFTQVTTQKSTHTNQTAQTNRRVNH